MVQFLERFLQCDLQSLPRLVAEQMGSLERAEEWMITAPSSPHAPLVQKALLSGFGSALLGFGFDVKNNRLQAGCAVPLMRAAMPPGLGGAISIAMAKSVALSQITQRTNEQFTGTPGAHFLSGVVAGVCESCLFPPLGNAKQYVLTEKAPDYCSALRQLFQEGGVRGLYKASSCALLCRNISFMSVYCTLFGMVSHPSDSLLTDAGKGGACAAIATVGSYPFERVRFAKVQDPALTRMPLWRVACKIYKMDGIRGMLRGGGTAMLRQFVVGTTLGIGMKCALIKDGEGT